MESKNFDVRLQKYCTRENLDSCLTIKNKSYKLGQAETKIISK